MSTWRNHNDITDPWSYYDYKLAFRNRNSSGPTFAAPSWVPEDDQRRLAAYQLLEDFCRNKGREWMDPETDQDQRQDHREYGDPGMVVHAVQSSVVGDSQIIMVEGATAEDPDVPGQATEQQDLLRDWMKQERFLVKMMGNELTCSKLGDQVYVLGWDDINHRPRVRCWNPGFYFPVLDDWANEEDYPLAVHMAWEYERPDANGKKKQYLRRITWRLVDTDLAMDYPWNATPVNRVCVMEELEWDMENIKTGSGLMDLDRGAALEIKPLTPLGIDFIPVVHIPNFPAEDEHWGTSSLALGMQVMDDLSSTDSDLQAAAATTGSPPLAVKDSAIQPDAEGNVTTYGPGQVFGGDVSVVDTSRSLDALLKLKEALQERVEVNLRVPKTLIGRIDPGKVNAGIILTLSFQPHSNMVRQMRLVRQDKYSLLLKFVSRLYIANNVISVALPAELKFGSYLPSDRSEVGEIVREGITAHSMSLETAVALMVEAGYPIEDANLEVFRIIARDYEAAVKAGDASGDLDFARSLLGLPPAPDLALPEGQAGDQGAAAEQLPPELPLPA